MWNYFKFLTLLWFVTSCKSNSLRETSGDDSSSLQDITINFPAANFPWNSSTTIDKQKQVVEKLSVHFSATKTDSSADCMEASDQVLTVAASGGSFATKGMRLTQLCNYKMLIKIGDGKTTFFETAAESLNQKVPIDGKINNFQICLVDPGEYFEKAKVASCVLSSDDMPKVDQGQSESNPLQMTVSELEAMLSPETDESIARTDAEIAREWQAARNKFSSFNFIGLYVTFEGYYLKTEKSNILLPRGTLGETPHINLAYRKPGLGEATVSINFAGNDITPDIVPSVYNALQIGVKTRVVAKVKFFNESDKSSNSLKNLAVVQIKQ